MTALRSGTDSPEDTDFGIRIGNLQFWAIKVAVDGRELDTIRGLTEAQKISLMEICRRDVIRATVIEYGTNRNPTGHEESVT